MSLCWHIGHGLIEGVFEELYGSLIADFGVNSLFKFTVQADDKDSSSYVIMVC